MISLQTPAPQAGADPGDRLLPLRHAAETACRHLDRDSGASLDYATSILLSARALSMVAPIWVRQKGGPRALSAREIDERLFRCGRSGRLPGMKGLEVMERDLERAIELLRAARTTLGASGIEFLGKPPAPVDEPPTPAA
jgi:hypothetical protein